MQDFTLGIVTLNVKKCDAAAMLDRIDGFAAEAAGQGVDLLVFPEYGIPGYVKDRAQYSRIASAADGPDIDRFGHAVMAGTARNFDGRIRSLRYGSEKIVVDRLHHPQHFPRLAFFDFLVGYEVRRGEVVRVIAHVTVNAAHP